MQRGPRNFCNLCDAFQHMAKSAWCLVHRNHTTPISIREDGITALNLQGLYLLQSQDFTVFDFSPHVESSTTGADWEWWFMQPGRNFGAAVQAKALSRNQEYDISYIPKKGYPQIKRLLDYSKTNALTPMYCFYNWWPTPPFQHWPCQSISEQNDLWGCALADGYVIWKLYRSGRYSLSDVHRLTMPWHCIVCCPGHNYGGAPTGPGTRAAGIARVLRTREIEEIPIEQSQEKEEYSEFPQPEIVTELPERISALRTLVGSREGISSDMVFELFGEYPPQRVILQGNLEES